MFIQRTKKSIDSNPIFSARTNKKSKDHIQVKQCQATERQMHPHKRQSEQVNKSGVKSIKQSYRFSLLDYMIIKQQMLQQLELEKQSSKKNKKIFTIEKDCFKILFAIGKGGFGKVWKVQEKKTRKIYAMKQMSKALVMSKRSVQSVLNQRQLLSKLHHPFLVNMKYAFQDQKNLYLVLDYLPGGDLRYLLGQQPNYTLSEEVTKFFVACLVVGLEYLHSYSIIHRDIKPENIILDKKGYLRITDLGVARIFHPQNYKQTSGTPGYMSPQVISRQNHSFPVDFFALGVIVYECMLGHRPFRGRNRQQIKQCMLIKQIQIKLNQIPYGWSMKSADFITKLLKRNPIQRLGTKGIHEIKNHAWLSDINWSALQKKKLTSPIQIELNNKNFDDLSDTQYDEETKEKISQNELMLYRQDAQKFFQGYQYQS